MILKDEMQNLLHYLKKEISANVDFAVIGLSGGADSTLVATLCRMALGNVNVLGVHMPCGETDVKTFNKRSENLADYLAIQQLKVPVTRIVGSLCNEVIS